MCRSPPWFNVGQPGRGGKAVHVGFGGSDLCARLVVEGGELYSGVLGFEGFLYVNAGETMYSGSCKLKLTLMVQISVYMMKYYRCLADMHTHTK